MGAGRPKSVRFTDVVPGPFWSCSIVKCLMCSVKRSFSRRISISDGCKVWNDKGLKNLNREIRERNKKEPLMNANHEASLGQG